MKYLGIEPDGHEHEFEAADDDAALLVARAQLHDELGEVAEREGATAWGTWVIWTADGDEVGTLVEGVDPSAAHECPVTRDEHVIAEGELARLAAPYLLCRVPGVVARGAGLTTVEFCVRCGLAVAAAPRCRCLEELGPHECFWVLDVGRDLQWVVADDPDLARQWVDEERAEALAAALAAVEAGEGPR